MNEGHLESYLAEGYEGDDNMEYLEMSIAEMRFYLDHARPLAQTTNRVKA